MQEMILEREKKKGESDIMDQIEKRCFGRTMEHNIKSEQKMVTWVFEYGSSMWKAGFHFDERVVGYRRVFHQLHLVAMDVYLSFAQ